MKACLLHCAPRWSRTHLHRWSSLPQYSPLFQALGTGGLQSLLEYLLERRLDAQEAFSRNIDGAKIVQQGIAEALNSPALAEPIADLRAHSSPDLAADRGR